MKQNETESESELRQERTAAELDVVFIDLKRDFAFKWAFGTEGHEDLLLMLLDCILPEKHIRSVTLGSQEQESDREDAQSGIFDICCKTDDGSSLTIEMQVCPQLDFNDRMVFYSSFPIRNRVGEGSVDNLSRTRYKLPPIYMIGILDFELSGIDKSGEVIRHFSIREDDGERNQFTDSIHFVTVELPKFNKNLSELESKLDYMLYAIKYTNKMKEMPKEFSGKGFEKLFEVCSFANMSEDMQMKYVRKMMAEWDREGQLATATIAGETKGVMKTAKAMKEKGLDPALISDITGLSQKQIEEI